MISNITIILCEEIDLTIAYAEYQSNFRSQWQMAELIISLLTIGYLKFGQPLGSDGTVHTARVFWSA